MLRPTALRAALAVLALLAPFSLPALAVPDQQVGDAVPETLASLTFGGSRSESIVDLGLDAAGNLYVLGRTTSPDFPVLNAAQPHFGSKSAEDGSAPGDAFVTSLTPDGRSMRYSTFIGGSGNEDPAAIAVTPAGVVYVAGATDSPDFPVAEAGGSFLGTAPRGETDGFLAALGPNGALLASGYFGGAKSDAIRALALASNGGLVITGETRSLDFPILAAFQPTHGGGSADAFVAMADAGLRRLRFSSFFGGDDGDGASAALVGPDGTIYVGGGTGSRNFPVRDAFQPVLPERARMASFVAGMHPDGSALRFSTYLGGVPTAESVIDLAIDTGGDLLAAIGVYQTGGVARITDGGRALTYAVYLGPPYGVAFDAEGHSFVAITPYPYKTGFVLPPGQQVPCPLNLPEIVELDAQGRVVAAMIAPVNFGTFVPAPGGRMILAGWVGSAGRWPPRANDEDDQDARVVVLRAGHGQMAWRWPPPFDGTGLPEFYRLWARTDAPGEGGRIASGGAWRWGPQPLTALTCEATRAQGGAYRFVQYFDKGRMEQNYSEQDPSTTWVSGGLLAVELISGQVQLGPKDVEQRQPSDEAVVGDPVAINPQAPTYRTLGAVAWPVNQERALPAQGALVTRRLHADGIVTNDPALRRYGVRLGPYDRCLGHNIAAVFAAWALRDEPVPLGLPLSEPYWVRARVGGQERELLIQPFERGVLSYTPDNAPAWRVELGNIGRHYLAWRYGQQ